MRLAFCTIAAANFAAYVRVLSSSCHRWHPEVPFYWLLLASPPQAKAETAPHARILTISEVAPAPAASFVKRYNPKELACALKPALLNKLFHSGHDVVVFLDADMWMLDRLDDVWDEISRHSFSLVPHSLHPAEDAGGSRFERELLLVGLYNGGLVGATPQAETLDFLQWWEQRLLLHCCAALPQGIHYDQRWLDFAPCFLAGFHILRLQGVNTAYWNCAELPPSARLRLVHFSGFDPNQPQCATIHRPGFTVDQTGPLEPLFAAYADRLWAEGHAEASRKAWRGGPHPSFPARCWRQARRLSSQLFGRRPPL